MGGTSGAWTDGFDGPFGEFAEWHESLTAEIVPSPDAPWYPDIAEFALTFDGYQALSDHIGDLANAAEHDWSENGALPSSLVELRSCLFFEHRRYRHFGWDPDEDAMKYIRALIEAIREGARNAGPTGVPPRHTGMERNEQ